MAIIDVGDDVDGVVALTSDAWFVRAGDLLFAAADAFVFAATADHATLMVDGTVLAHGGSAVVVAPGADGCSVVVEAGGSLAAASGGISFQGDGGFVRNGGEITSFVGTGVLLAGGQNQLVNSGAIAGAGIGVAVLGGGAVVTNAGLISGATALSVDDLAAEARIANTGTIVGDVVLAGELAFLGNAGTIDGDVYGDDSAMQVVSAGLITGTVSMGGGDDRFSGRGGASVLVFGDAGKDLLQGGSDADSLSGGFDRDLLAGGAGDDVLLGDTGDDGLDGGAGDDTLFGGGEADSVAGGGGADWLTGDDGRDTLSGGGGDDVVDGGAGNDVLTGGGGGDTFVFAADGGRDRVVDFRDGVDRLDLTAFGFESRTEALALFANGDGGVVFAADNQNRLTLDGLSKAQIADELLF